MRAASLLGSRTTISPRSANPASSSARGNRVVFPAPGGASRTSVGHARRDAMMEGSSGSIGSACKGAVDLTPNLPAPGTCCHPHRVLSRGNVALAPLTTLRIGGPAARMVDLEREEDLTEALREAKRRDEPVVVLGGGSNVVVADAGFPGLVLKMAMRGVEVASENGRALVSAAAGEDWDTLVARAVGEGWRGLEAMSGIPGLVGATPIQNVGAYGQDVSESLVRVRVFDRAEMAFRELDPG